MTAERKKRILFSLAAILIFFGGILLCRMIPVRISIRTLPDRTSYDHGDTLDCAGLTLELTYLNGRTEVITEGFHCSPMELTQAGTQEIQVAWENLAATFPVEVVGISQIEIKRFSARDVYLVGEYPEPEDAILKVTYTDGSTVMVSEGYTVSGGPFTEPGPGAYSIIYQDHQIVYPVTVFPPMNFDTFTAFFTSIDNGTKISRNDNGARVYWLMYMDVDFPKEAMDRIIPVVTCSWTDEISRYRNLGHAYLDAQEGKTTVEFCPFPAEYSPTGNHRINISLYLPDDPAIEGQQSITILFGADEITIDFTLKYRGDYKTGTGWSCTDIRY